MRLIAWAVLSAMPVGWGYADDALFQRVRNLELRGEGLAARQALEAATRFTPRDAAVWAEYAQFLDQRRDPGAREALRRAAELASGVQKRDLARRLAALDLAAGDTAAANRSLDLFREAGGTGLELKPGDAGAGGQFSTVEIPGPLRSFARMAALSPEVPPSDVLSALARNVITSGFQASGGADQLEPTEYLKLVVRYLSQARELTKLAGEKAVIRLEQCDSSQTAELLKVLGFRIRGACGAEVVLETVNASRAFLSMDSGFPLAELEEALRTNRPFEYDYRPSKVRILYTADYWLAARDKQSGDFIDAFLSDPSLCRFYLGMFKLDPETAEAMKKGLSPQRIRAFSHVFDFFGGMFRIRGGVAAVPGGARSAAAWGELVGATPDQGAVFYEKLVVKDDGWLASYYDSLSRLSGPVLDYLTEPNRLKRFYSALRGRVTSPGPARPVFRSNTDLMLLTTRMRVGADGRPHIPGNLELWKNLFVNHPHGKYDGKLTKAAAGWKEPDELIEALFGLSRKAVENEPLKIFLAITDIDRRRNKPLEAPTVDRLMRDYRAYGAQYLLFTEAPDLSDKTILAFLNTAAAISDIRDQGAKANAAGLAQSLTGLWQVLYRQKLMQPELADETLQTLVTPFLKARSSLELFDAGRAGVQALLRAAGGPAGADPQERLLELMSGAASPADVDSQQTLVAEMRRGFEAQKLVSLKTILDLAQHLEAVSQGQKLDTALVNRLAARVSDLGLPRTGMSAQERNSLSFGFYTERHIDAQRRLNFRAVVDRAAGQPEKLREARGLLTPLLRDTLVGLLYLHYAPPGAQILYTNPLFARSHDFIGIHGAAQTWKATEILGSGWPSSAGGRLVGSLATLPYALAEAEQNFLIPTREQALIWGDLVPQMLVSARLPRWWDVTPAQMHFAALHLRAGEAWIADAALSAASRAALIEQLERHAPPQRVRRVLDLLEAGRPMDAAEDVTPSEMYHLGRQAAAQNLPFAGRLAARIRELQQADPQHLSHSAISAAFGTPKPTLSNSFKPELLGLRTFPTLMGYSSRIMAETWESNNLYFAALADELYFQPSQLNYLIPEWTQKTVEQIFATHLEDWPAVLRSMRIIGDNVRAEARKTGLRAANE